MKHFRVRRHVVLQTAGLVVLSIGLALLATPPVGVVAFAVGLIAFGVSDEQANY
jgi:hypothetical protein